VTRSRLRRLLASSALVLLVAAGCGIPLDSSPRQSPVETKRPPRPEATTVEGGFGAWIYLTHDGRLLATFREVVDRRPATILDSLLLPVPANEVSRGYVTQIPSGTEALAVRRTDQSIVVDLDASFNDVIGAARQKAIAQIVFTMTDLQGVSGVRFAVDGKAVDVSTPNRGDVERVTDCDFMGLLPSDEDLAKADIDDVTAQVMRARRRATENRCPDLPGD
jgi:hypothetical protein